MDNTSLGQRWLRPLTSFAAASLYGAVLWGTAPIWAGKKEPWDGSFPVYMIVLTCGGLVAAICPRRPLLVPAGLVVGQVGWQIFGQGAGSLWPLSMILLSVLSVPAAAVAGVIWLVDRRNRPRPGPNDCPACGYDRGGLGGRACPECGADAKSRGPSVGPA